MLHGARITVRDGSIDFSDGTNTPADVTIRRSTTGTLRVTGALAVDGAVSNSGVTMASVYVAAASATLPGDLPAGLPSGTVVIQLDN